MTNISEIYKCNVCGNMIDVVHAGAGELVCCGKPMNRLQENTVEASKEKHVPVAERNGDSLTVKVGSIFHPMEEKHYIEWIEVIADGKTYREFLKPGQTPQAIFNIGKATSYVVREYCNLHGLWKA